MIADRSTIDRRQHLLAEMRKRLLVLRSQEEASSAESLERELQELLEHSKSSVA